MTLFERPCSRHFSLPIVNPEFEINEVTKPIYVHPVWIYKEQLSNMQSWLAASYVIVSY